ncbi:hypothetical protein [Runella sp.]|uniref:hypothetical protein n=1 Tax=Runella sp. TaxID=1960881 RepID=UPI003D0F0E05
MKKTAAAAAKFTKGFQFESMTLKIPAGYTDSIAHRHDAEVLLIYIIKQGRNRYTKEK